MGTRHLIAVQVDGEYKVAQYGQWDGYPSGQGASILHFLTSDTFDKTSFTEAVRACSEITEEEYQAAWVSCGARPERDWIPMSVSETFRKTFPHLHRSCGAKILDLVQNARPNGLKVIPNLNFAGDSLYCEWAYVIDLDKNTLEVFRGFNNEPLNETERFVNVPTARSDYYQVKFLREYNLDSLPSIEEFIEELEPSDDE